ncbi:MAG: fibronectin type III domain-containing protein [Thaumarchaeota archaeon]|nr:fibronectin type III domain-containing protein [Nitrososphaerota archaeon]
MHKAVLSIPFLVVLLITSSFAVPGAFAQNASGEDHDDINGPGGLFSLTGNADHKSTTSSDPLKIKEHHPAHLKKFAGKSVSLSGGDSPASVLTAYGFNNLSCTHTTTTDWTDPSLCGHGQTIAIVDAYDDPNAASDLQTFDSQFNLPACTVANGCFVKSAPSGIATDSGWAMEISLDVQWAHSIAPGAKIVLVESSDNSLGNLLGGENTAVATGAQQVSNSWGGSEFSGESSYDSYFNSPTTSFFVASGDGGHGAEWPAASPYVVSVGGTTLNIDSSGNWLSETAWSGSGGGFSKYVPQPSYQKNFVSNSNRAVPDVAYNGDPNTGVYVYDSVPINGQSGWWIVGGTSAGTPQWTAISAIANSQGAKLASASFGTNIALYNAATGSQSSPQTTPYLNNYHDITLGSNGNCGAVCNSIVGYDEVTGLGSPKANNIISYLSQPVVPTAPSAPQNLVAKAGNGQISLSWNQPSSNGGSTITGYNVYRGTTPGGEGATPIVTGLTTTSYTDSGLTNGQTYYYTVTAVNTVGQSSASNEASATPQQTPTLSVSVTTDKSSYSRGTTAHITVKVTSNSTPISGSSVTISVTSPNDSVSHSSAKTNSSGSVTFSYSIGRHSAVGTYTVNVQASASGYNSGTGTTQFTVH